MCSSDLPRFLLLTGSLTGLTLPEKNTTKANTNMQVHLTIKRCICNWMCTNYSTMSSPQSGGCVHVCCGLRDRSSMCEGSGGGWVSVSG